MAATTAALPSSIQSNNATEGLKSDASADSTNLTSILSSKQKQTTVTVTETPSQMQTTQEQPRSSITIRQATYRDLSNAGICLARAFNDDVLFGALIHPYRQRFPLQMSYYWLRRFQRDYWDYEQVIMVASTDHSATDTSSSYQTSTEGNSKIVGVAQWHRQGPSSIKHGWGLRSKLDPRNLLYYFGVIHSVISAWLWPNTAADPLQEDVIERSSPYLDHIWTGKRADGWYLHFLGVDPDYHSRGIGRQLVKWGLDMAEKENVSASVVSAHGKDNFYQNCGFTTTAGRSGDGEGNPLADIPGGNIWFVDR